MGTNPINLPERDLRTLFSVGTLGGLSDGYLLGRFAIHREEAAFEALIQRHGPMVWGVCRRILRDHHDAEEAFQATFVVLARKAPSIAHRELVVNWLYAVACKSALKAKAITSKRRTRERLVVEMPEPEAEPNGMTNELLSQLDQALSHLPDKYRVPIVLCELEGKTHREAAEQLGWPIGTVSGRLSRARVMLANRLSRSGLRLSVGSLAVLLAQDVASASMPTKLIRSTSQSVSLSVAGRALTAGMVSPGIATLTGEVMKTMLLSRLKLVSGVLLTLTLTGVGILMASSAPILGHEPGNAKRDTGAEDIAKAETERLQGTWVITRLEQVNHQPTKDEEEYWKSGSFTITIKGNRFTFNSDNSFTDFKLDPSQTPKLMTFEVHDGPNKGQVAPAIYRLDGDDLMICQGRGGDTVPPVDFSIENRRPRTFPTLLVLKRKSNLQERFRATVNEVVSDDTTIVTNVGIETPPGSRIEVISDKPNQGGGDFTAASTDLTQPSGSAYSQILIFADHVEWKAGSTNALKFMMKFKGGRGTSSMSDTGPMPGGKRLAEILTVTIKPGEYKYGMMTELLTFKGVTYSLVVKLPVEAK